MTSEDGSLIIKPALPVEIDFYQSVASDRVFAPLKPFIPKFYGTLKFEGTLEKDDKAATNGNGNGNGAAALDVDLTHLRPTKDDRRDKDEWFFNLSLRLLALGFQEPS